MPKNKWKFEDIPDQTGRIAIVTGANSGTGYEAAKALARKGAHVVMGCRNQEKAEKAKNDILSEYPEVSLEIIQLDLADLSSVKKFVEEFNKNYQSLDLLLNNAGVMMVPYQKTTDGFEMQLGTNHLGHFALTGLLLDKLLKSDNSRIVNMSSSAHLYGKMDFEDLQWEQSYNKVGAYGRSKLANLLFTYELNRKLEKTGNKTISAAAHPGWTRTNLQRHAGALKLMNPLFGMKPLKGVLSMLYAATDDDVEGGNYYGPGGVTSMTGYPKKIQSNKKSYNLEDAKKLWEISEKLTGVKFNI
ncbi:MAG: SDR family NAD(P)-dependent oxidoreductase [Candidatus Heimdallarchaeota archaeon]|nr:SDR family NAD(P)-dependent oxidoreductase [Candidatus Heimdallarchaeota archaeon]